MRRLYAIWDRVDVRLHHWLVSHSVTLLRVTLGGIFLGFGVLKFFPGLSPAAALAEQTFGILTFGLVPAAVARVLIAILECAIGLCFITGKGLRVGVWLLAVQMLGALSPLLLLAGEMFSGPHHAPSLEGQYVIKDVVTVAAGMVIAATVRGGRLVSGKTGATGVTRTIPRQAEANAAPQVPSPARGGVTRTRSLNRPITRFAPKDALGDGD